MSIPQLAVVVFLGGVLVVGIALCVLDIRDTRRKRLRAHQAQAEMAWRTIGAAHRITTAFMHAQEAMRAEAARHLDGRSNGAWYE
jgi:hypothetical protein